MKPSVIGNGSRGSSGYLVYKFGFGTGSCTWLIVTFIYECSTGIF